MSYIENIKVSKLFYFINGSYISLIDGIVDAKLHNHEDGSKHISIYKSNLIDPHMMIYCPINGTYSCDDKNLISFSKKKAKECNITEGTFIIFIEEAYIIDLD